ncbi:MAG: Peptidyl-prolyl cis-trans isomerase cyp8 [Peltula sp. TS41687]|nr:MAG: Peptidyl-prolyl cis-trans isomerase cyp8 [Peltula sp. TS41687]
MGKGTDKLYITHSEWSSSDAYSASVGASSSTSVPGGSNNSGTFKRLPFNYCALTLQPFTHPVCTSAGLTFELTHILPWLKKHGDTNPVDGSPLQSSELIKLHFARNDEGEYVDPVTYRVFTDNTHIVALRNTGNVFAYDTVERLNVKPKMWRDLLDDTAFARSDIVTLQDPADGRARDVAGFQYRRDGAGVQEQESGGVNLAALGSSAKVLRAKEAVDKARRARQEIDANRNPAAVVLGARTSADGKTGKNNNGTAAGAGAAVHSTTRTSSTIPYNAAQHTTGKAAASFTSTGLTPHTSGERALLTEEEYMLKPRRVKEKGYARIQTTLGDLNVELQTEYAPRAVWNFVHLAKQGYYKGVAFHRNIRNFMIQGGDPTGTGRGGSSVWGKNFNDEFDGPLTHDSRGVISMANKGKNTNSSQFFITYREAKHLDRKHTIFGKVVGGLETLSRLENAPTDSSTNRPSEPIEIIDVVVFVDPFEEFRKQQREKEEEEKEREAVRRSGGREDERTTWTGKRIRGVGVGVDRGGDDGGGVGVSSVGKYLKASTATTAGGGGSSNGGGGQGGRKSVQDEVGGGDWQDDNLGMQQPSRKKIKGGGAGGFGNFDNW